MPLYEYICGDCQARSRLLVRSAGQRIACPECGSRKMDRQLSTFAAISGGGGADACPALGSCPVGDPGACSAGRCPMF